MLKPVILNKIYPKSIAKREYPVNYKEQHKEYFEHEIERVIPESNLLFFKTAFVTDQGIVLKRRGIFKEYIINYDADFKKYYWRYYLHTFLKLKKTTLDYSKKYLLLFDNYSGPDGYAHWILDTLLRIFAVKDIINDYTVILTYYCKVGFKHVTLELFSINEKYYIEKNNYVKVHNLYVPSFIAPTGNFNIENVNSFRKWLWEKIPEKLDFKINEKIYISRRKTGRRLIINENEIENILKHFGFEVIYIEDYSFYEQVSIIYNTKYLISLHGAALANIIFMKPYTSLLELRLAGDMNNNVFFSLANALNIKYFYQLCKGEIISDSANNFNIEVDPIEFKRTITEMIDLFR